MLRDGDDNAAFASWGHEVIAPADGIVVHARNDVPDNPPGMDPASIFAKLPEPVRVARGQRVERGEVIGRIGSSGDSFQPHLHYQLQSGPELFRDPSLPVRFENLAEKPLVRGAYFDAGQDR